MMMLYYASLDSFRPPSSGELIMLLCSSLFDTCNKNFGTNFGPACPYIDNLGQELAIGDCTTLGWCIIHL